MEDRWASRVGLEAMQKRFAEERKLVGVQLSEAQEANDHAGEKRASARLKELSAISTRIAEFLKITKDKSQAKAEPASIHPDAVWILTGGRKHEPNHNQEQ